MKAKTLNKSIKFHKLNKFKNKPPKIPNPLLKIQKPKSKKNRKFNQKLRMKSNSTK